MQDRTAIIIPTYNEAENIRELITAILKRHPQVKIFVVDDNSPDGTSEVVQRLVQEYANVRLLRRDKKEGLASAYLDAFARIIPDEGLEYIVTMDGDFSHHPDNLAAIFQSLANYDVVIGSRYTIGGSVTNWNWWRRFLSRYGNIYARWITGIKAADLTAGFVGYRRTLLGRILLLGIKSRNYAYQIEMKYLAYRLGAKIKEVPIAFQERQAGSSKLGQSTIWEGIVAPWYMRFWRRIQKS